MTEASLIEDRIAETGPGHAFTASDFSDLTSMRNAGNVLGRMHSKGRIERALRGIYYVPEHSELLGSDVPASVDEVVHAIARANKWVIAPAGDAALNALGLDTQVPARHIYVSSGPYKSYEYGPYRIELRHRANRDLLDCSEITCTIIQALKTLGRDRVGPDVVKSPANNLSADQVDAFEDESAGLTSWVAEFAKALWREKHGQDS